MSENAPAPRQTGEAVKRGFRCRCPACGEGRLFGKFLKGVPACASCGEKLDGHRADDLPAYIVITIVGHVIVGLLFSFEMSFSPPIWLHLAIWLPLTLVLALALIQPVKGALIGYQWALRMHGFDPAGDIHATVSEKV